MDFSFRLTEIPTGISNVLGIPLQKSFQDKDYQFEIVSFYVLSLEYLTFALCLIDRMLDCNYVQKLITFPFKFSGIFSPMSPRKVGAKSNKEISPILPLGTIELPAAAINPFIE